MKISSKQAWDVLEISNHYWVETLKEHGEGEVNLEAFAHMIAFKLGTAIHDVVNAELVAAVAEGVTDATPETVETTVTVEEPEGPRVLH